MYFQTALSTFPVEKEIFAKEYDSGLYGIVPYYFSKLMIEIPLTAFFPTLFSCIVYYLVNFNDEVINFFTFILITILLSLTATFMGIFIGTLVPSLSVAIDIAPMVFVPFLLFSGYTTNTDNIIAPLKAIEYISPIRYAFEYFVRNEFEDYEEVLGKSNPIDTLNFELNMLKLFFILIGYCSLLIILSLIALKFNTKRLKN